MAKGSLPRYTLAAALKTGLALLGGGLAYSLWLVLVLIISTSPAAPIRPILWLLAPVITAGGFTCAAIGYDRLSRKQGRNPWNIYIWSLSACGLGAVLVYRFGPMLIVFGMLSAGTLTIAWLELAHTFGGKGDDITETR